MGNCKFCGETDIDNFQFDNYNLGFWCEVCDVFNYIDDEYEDKHKHILILEDAAHGQDVKVKPDIKFKKHISPLRYPGGKSKLIDYVYTKLNLNKTHTLIEPFSGGASVGLSLLDAGVIDNLIINDLDYGIYSLFYFIKHEPEKLIERITKSNPTHKDYFMAQEIIYSNYRDCNMIESAWALLLVNRLAFSGIYKANPLGGKNGTIKDLLVRWNPDTLRRRLLNIHKISNKITVLNVDAFELIEEQYWNEKATIFVDPPYYRKGKDLYNLYFNREEHIRLNILIEGLYGCCPGADIITTYDNESFIEYIYIYSDIEKIKRVYSI